MLATPRTSEAETRTVKAGSMAAALAEVKRSLGPDAVIHRTRSYRQGALLGLGGRQVVEIVASRPPANDPPSPAPARPDPLTAEERRARARQAGGARPQPAARPAADPMPPHEADAPARNGVAALAVPVRLNPADAAAACDLEAELGSIKRMLGQVLRTAGSVAAPPPGLPEPLRAVHRGLLEVEAPKDAAADAVDRARAELTPAELADPEILKTTLARALEPRFRTSRPAVRSAADAARARRVALVGPTGVGKTTTIAKLAATAALRHGKRVGLITCDTYRIAAVEQLRTYATLIGLPLEVAQTPEDMTAAVAALDGCDVVFIDTAGRSHRDGCRLSELGLLLGSARPDEVHLVLSAATSPGGWRSAAERFAPLGADRVILSKLDECPAVGAVIGIEDAAGLPLSYLTDGQDVPDHIEPARAERLARLVVDAAIEAGSAV